MAKTKKFFLEDDDLFDFKLIAILCFQKDYRLCYELNASLDADMERRDDLDAVLQKQKETDTFSLFTGKNSEGILLTQIENRNGRQKYLLPELQGIDYLLKCEGNIKEDELKEMIRKIKSISIVNGAYPVDLKKLKNKEYLIF